MAAARMEGVPITEPSARPVHHDQRGPGRGHAHVYQNCPGEANWAAFFPTEPAKDAVVPKQALELVLGSLEKLSLKWESDDQARKTQEAAAGSYAKLEGTAKRRRAEMFDLPMPEDL